MNGAKTVPWIFSILSGLLLFLANMFNNNLSSLAVRLSLIEQQQASMAQKLTQIDDLVNITRKEQVERTVRFSDISSKIVSVENEQRWFNDRLKTMSERMLTINGRLDALGSVPSKSGDMDPFSIPR